MILLMIFFVRDTHSFTASPVFKLYAGQLFVPTGKAIWFSTDKHLSDMGLSTLEIGDAQLCSVAEIVSKSPFLCVNRWGGHSLDHRQERNIVPSCHRTCLKHISRGTCKSLTNRYNFLLESKVKIRFSVLGFFIVIFSKSPKTK